MSFFIAGVLVLVLILVGCGGDSTPSQSPGPDNPVHEGSDPDVPSPEGPDPDVPSPEDPDLFLLQPGIYTTRLDQSITFDIQGSDPL